MTTSASDQHMKIPPSGPARFRENDRRRKAAEVNLSAAPSRILIIDDAPAIHNDFQKILTADKEGSALDAEEAALFGQCSAPAIEERHFILDSAYQGGEAVAMFERAFRQGIRYAMAFVDVRMPPGLDGIETTERLWRIDPDLQIVICTAYSDYSCAEMIQRLGKTDRLVILKKPFDIIEVQQLANAL